MLYYLSTTTSDTNDMFWPCAVIIFAQVLFQQGNLNISTWSQSHECGSRLIFIRGESCENVSFIFLFLVLYFSSVI